MKKTSSHFYIRMYLVRRDDRRQNFCQGLPFLHNNDLALASIIGKYLASQS